MVTRLGQKMHEWCGRRCVKSPRPRCTQPFLLCQQFGDTRWLRLAHTLPQPSLTLPPARSVAVTNRINENDGRTAFAGRLDEEVALKKAADFIGEVFIFTVRRFGSCISQSSYCRQIRPWRSATRRLDTQERMPGLAGGWGDSGI